MFKLVKDSYTIAMSIFSLLFDALRGKNREWGGVYLHGYQRLIAMRNS